MNDMSTPSPITSRQNQRVKDAVRLRTGRERERRGQFLIDGSREIERAIQAGIRPIEAFVCEPLSGSPRGRATLDALRRTGAELLAVTPEVHEKLRYGDRDDVGIVVVAETPRRELDNLKLPIEPLVAVVEGIEKPGNLGAILRSADAAGVHAVLVAHGRSDLYNPNTIRASLGAVFRDTVVAATSAEATSWLEDHQLKIVLARPDAEALYTAADFRGGVAIILGSEASGLSAVWLGMTSESVRLPMCGLADSLNVSVAAAVLFYEALRQRTSQ